ncbi:hypothetical protein [Campylobacter phage vB_CcoM-IBB_35]|uniref:Uncharacterized protein n=1 Tax=Campylobacter virus IBB35 TaxID=1006972 RepID=H6SU92_9CAUD|nr:hypothetical protein FDG52_s1gp49 [Campylobacter phage vB_CcoM-IBB_35]AEF56784.1 hypothetical protein [Campylobacter phage vB_CcoM-IBB_35]
MRLRGSRIDKMIKKNSLATIAAGEFKYVNQSKTLWYNIELYFVNFFAANIFKIELNNYGDQKFENFYLITPAYEFLTPPIKTLPFKYYLFNALNMNKLSIFSEESVASLTDLNSYAEHKDAIIHKEGAIVFTSYCSLWLVKDLVQIQYLEI